MATTCEGPVTDISTELTEAVEGGQWREVLRLVHTDDCSHEQRHWAMERVVKEAPKWFINDRFDEISDRLDNICDNCAEDMLGSVLSHLLTRRLWRCVGRVLQRDISPTLHRWAVEQASTQAGEEEFADYILPHCAKKELGQVLTHMVSRGLWEPADSVTDSDVSVAQHILSQLVSHGLWNAVGRFLERDINSAERRWVVEQAVNLADEWEVTCHILPHCREEELEQVLAHMVSRGLWEPFVAKRDVSVTQHILSQLMLGGLWLAVGRFLQQEVGSAAHGWAVEQASKYASDYDFACHILPQCHVEELRSVLRHLVNRDHWELVGRVLEKGVSSEQHSWTVRKASRRASADDFVCCILPRCHNEELETVIRHLVSRGLWEAVDKVLERGVSTKQHSWVYEQASRHANYDDFVHYVLPHCHDEELESVITHLVSEGLWWSFVKVLRRVVSSAHHRWAVEHASRHADDDGFVHYVLPQCHDDELKSVMTHLVSRGLWKSVGKVLRKGVSSTHHRWAVEQASRHADDHGFCHYILPHCHDDLDNVLFCLLSRGQWRSVSQLCANSARHRSVHVEADEHANDASFLTSHSYHWSEETVVAAFPNFVADKLWKCTQHVLGVVVRDTLYTWMTSQQDSQPHDTLFWKFIHNCHVEASLGLGLTKAVTQHSYDARARREDRFFVLHPSSDLAWRASWKRALCEALMTSLLHTLCDMMICSDDREYTDSAEHTRQCVIDIYSHITACVEDNTHCLQDSTLKTIQNKQKWTSVFTELADLHYSDPLFLLHFLQGLNLYHISRRGENDDSILLVMLAVFPLFPQLQSVALRMMLREKRWDVISQACLSHVWEHDRRRLFKAAVMQRQWDVVRQWCDHTVHDDQRHWALTEAFKEKQWEVFLLLADHGLTPAEHMCVHYRLAKHGDWDTVLHMVERGGDITEVSDMLENWVTGNLRKKPEGDVTVYEERCLKLIRLRLRFAQKAALSPRKALERCLWGSVLFNILHEPTQHYFSQVLHKVIEEQKWHILMHLVRLGMTSADRDRLFPDMVRQQQWGVCAMLLECGVDDQLCLEALPELMERKQWTLVARVMEHDVDDAVRRQVMHWAFQRRAGALFWHCLTTMKDQEHLSKETQGKLFHQAISRDIWQAVKPLVKEKDGPNIQRRDLAFLEAIEQHLWDVVDYCQPLGADINMEDENGETPLHREARKEEWKAVEEIVLRDGQPNLLDKDGVSVLNRLIDHEQWDIVKIVIMYGGDIHLSARYSENWSFRDTHTPLQALITARQADVIHSTIRWCGDQDKGVNDRGERVLHAVCDSDRWDVMRDLIDIKVNPLAVTKTGKSPLVYAVLNTKCGKRMVAECSRQGFSSHQPSVTGPQESLLEDVSSTVVEFSPTFMSPCNYIRWNTEITSPLVCAVLCDLPVVALMLYESGSCANTELFTLYTQLPKLTDLNTEEGRRLHEEVSRKVERRQASDDWVDRQRACSLLQSYSRLTHTLEQYTSFLREVATTPRTLLSSCRLMISHGFHFSNKCRHEEMDQLPLPVSMKEYLMFSDLCDPDYGGHML